jgi:hypothetical protein
MPAARRRNVIQTLCFTAYTYSVQLAALSAVPTPINASNQKRGTSMMSNLGWLQPVLIAAAVVFVLDLIGNMLSFSNRFVNALVTALLFAIIFGGLIQAGIVQVDAHVVPAAAAPAAAPAK